jgi:hypothetical protein
MMANARRSGYVVRDRVVERDPYVDRDPV